MIERIEWGHPYHSELPSPFMRGLGERNLRVTLDSDNLTGLPAEEDQGLAVLRELGHLPAIDLVETQPSDNHPYLQIDFASECEDCIPVQLIENGRPMLYTGVENPSQWREIAQSLVGDQDQPAISADRVFAHLVTAQAHLAIHGDIFVTFPTRVQTHLEKSILHEANLRTPQEVLKIAGLFLRSRDNYVYQAAPRNKATFDRGLFYLVLTRYHLPNMWRYFNACVLASKIRNDDTLELGQAIFTRIKRALQTRDSIGVQFYRPQDNNTRDQMMYHFDYLTLVLVGAFDAEARIAHRAYGIKKPDEYAMSFRSRKSLKALETVAGKLHTLVASTYADLLWVLHTMRNTVHGAAMLPIAYHEMGASQASYVEVPEKAHSTLLNMAKDHGGASRWGFDLDAPRTPLEPYTFCSTLLEECLTALNAIAGATAVERLFPKGESIPNLRSQTPNDKVFRHGRRLSLLA